MRYGIFGCGAMSSASAMADNQLPNVSDDQVACAGSASQEFETANAAIAEAPQIVVPIPIRHRMRQCTFIARPIKKAQIRPAPMVISSTGSDSATVRRITPRSRLAPSSMLPPFRHSLLLSPTRRAPM